MNHLEKRKFLNIRSYNLADVLCDICNYKVRSKTNQVKQVEYFKEVGRPIGIYCRKHRKSTITKYELIRLLAK